VLSSAVLEGAVVVVVVSDVFDVSITGAVADVVVVSDTAGSAVICDESIGLSPLGDAEPDGFSCKSSAIESELSVSDCFDAVGEAGGVVAVPDDGILIGAIALGSAFRESLLTVRVVVVGDDDNERAGAVVGFSGSDLS